MPAVQRAGTLRRLARAEHGLGRNDACLQTVHRAMALVETRFRGPAAVACRPSRRDLDRGAPSSVRRSPAAHDRGGGRSSKSSSTSRPTPGTRSTSHAAAWMSRSTSRSAACTRPRSWAMSATRSAICRRWATPRRCSRHARCRATSWIAPMCWLAERTSCARRWWPTWPFLAWWRCRRALARR